MLRTRIDSKKYNAMIFFTDSGTTIFPYFSPRTCHCQLSKTIVLNHKILKHRLVQEGAILESIVPHIKEMDLDSLKRELMIRLRGM